MQHCYLAIMIPLYVRKPNITDDRCDPKIESQQTSQKKEKKSTLLNSQEQNLKKNKWTKYLLHHLSRTIFFFSKTNQLNKFNMFHHQQISAIGVITRHKVNFRV